jgi:hypothetical protein
MLKRSSLFKIIGIDGSTGRQPHRSGLSSDRQAPVTRLHRQPRLPLASSRATRPAIGSPSSISARGKRLMLTASGSCSPPPLCSASSPLRANLQARPARCADRQSARPDDISASGDQSMLIPLISSHGSPLASLTSTCPIRVDARQQPVYPVDFYALPGPRTKPVKGQARSAAARRCRDQQNRAARQPPEGRMVNHRNMRQTCPGAVCFCSLTTS